MKTSETFFGKKFKNEFFQIKLESKLACKQPVEINLMIC